MTEPAQADREPRERDPREYPPYVGTDEQRKRWDFAAGIAEETFPDLPDQAWQMTRSLYGSDLPT